MKGMKNIDELIQQAPPEHQEALRSEKSLYQRIHENTKSILAAVGIETRHRGVIELLEATGLAGYDETTARIYLMPELIDQALDSAPETFAGDEGRNTLGIGGIPPFLYRETDQYPMPASYDELDRVIKCVGQNLDVVRFLSQPVKVHKGDPLKCNQIMDQLTDCIKVTCSAYMNQDESVNWFAGRDDWHDSICGVKSPLICMDDMMGALMRSARAGNNIRLTTMPLAGRTAPQTPEACIMITHAEVLFMLAVVQTIKPGALCMYGGMPCPTLPEGDLAYSDDSTNLLNAAVARLNIWITGLPSVQSGGSTAQKQPGDAALQDGIRGRHILCKFGVHNARHCFGVLDNLNFFSEAAFELDCQAQRQALAHVPTDMLAPLYLPADDHATEVIERVASNDYHVDFHTTANIAAFDNWSADLIARNILPARP